MKFIYVKTNKSEGWTVLGVVNRTIAELAIAIENCGHVILEMRVIDSQANSETPNEFRF